MCEMAIDPLFTFNSRFAVQKRRSNRSAVPVFVERSLWGAEIQNINWGGRGWPCFEGFDGLTGPRPQFELCAGWLTVLPSGQLNQCFPLHWFDDAKGRRARAILSANRSSQQAPWDAVSHHEDSQEATKVALQGGRFDSEKFKHAMDDANRRSGRGRI
jgi:hypothetical protein